MGSAEWGGGVEQFRTERGQELSELYVGANRELRGATASGTFPHVVQDGGNR